jgi:hypothetical protein
VQVNLDTGKTKQSYGARHFNDSGGGSTSTPDVDREFHKVTSAWSLAGESNNRIGIMEDS